MALTKGFELLALRLQEAAVALSHGDLRRGLYDTLSDFLSTPLNGGCPMCGKAWDGTYRHCYGYVLDVFGTAEAGDVVFCAAGDCYRAPYTSSMTDGKRSHSIDFAAKVDVLPRTVYDEELGEAIAANEAGVKPAGRATVRRRAAAAPPVEGQGQPGEQAHTEAETALVGDIVDLREGAVGLDGTANLKLIAPGWGSSGYYSEAVLKRDGPKIFTAGTQNFWNHPTETEEAERPEGSLRDLASVLTEDAKYLDDGPAGPGLYARAKVFPEFREHVDSLAPHIGMSIRASGISREGSAEGRKGPVIEKLTRAASVDYVTRPGAGGKVLQLFEAARRKPAPQISHEVDMDQAEFKKLQERLDRQDADNRRLRERLALSDAATAVDGLLGPLRINPAIKARVKRRVLESDVPLTEAGELDQTKLKGLVEAEVKEECEYIERIAPTGRPVNLGAAAADPAAQDKQLDEAHKAAVGELADFFVGDEAGDRGKRMREAFVGGRA